VPKRRKQGLAAIRVLYHPLALSDMKKELDTQTMADVVALAAMLNGRTQPEIVALLENRSEKKVCQWEGSHRQGALRVIFAWGKAGLWLIGAFVKHNDEHGERLARRILPRAKEVLQRVPN
jgi:hypothetical protein